MYSAEQLAQMKLLIDSGEASYQMILEYSYLTQQAQRVRKAKFQEIGDENISQEDN